LKFFSKRLCGLYVYVSIIIIIIIIIVIVHPNTTTDFLHTIQEKKSLKVVSSFHFDLLLVLFTKRAKKEYLQQIGILLARDWNFRKKNGQK
jgi:hypothetical protein